MLATIPYIWRFLSSLPYILIAMWVLWLCFVPAQVTYMFRKDAASHQLKKTGELMNFREIVAVGCVGGFILLTFITAFCSWITLKLNNVI